MTPKEKAEELIKKYAKQLYFSEEIKIKDINISEANLDEPKECALIAVDEVKESLKSNIEYPKIILLLDYWNEVI